MTQFDIANVVVSGAKAVGLRDIGRKVAQVENRDLGTGGD
jgi:hypothetical protein